jgi:predicted permease
MHAFLLDLRVTLRGLARAPAFTAAALLSLALGIGANSTVFSWLESMVLKPYPVIPESDRLVVLNMAAPDGDDWPLSYPVYREWRAQSRSFEGIAAWSVARISLREPQEKSAAPVWSMLVSGDYFDVLRVRPSVGRGFTREEETAGAPVAVLAHDYWLRRFAGARSIVGRTILLNGQPITIIGVAPQDFHGTYVGVTFDLWLPLTLQQRLLGGNTLEDRAARWLQAVARLAPGVSRAQARHELDALARNASSVAGDRPVTGALVRLPREQFLGSLIFPLFSALFAITALVLLVACVNLAGLLLVRVNAGQRERALRLAVGANRAALLRLVLLESGLLALAGGALGLLIAFALRGVFYRFIPPVAYTIALPIVINLRVLALTAGVTVVTACLVGLLPALRGARLSAAAVLRQGTRAGAARDSRLRNTLVTAQIAFAFVCLISAGLFLRSLSESLAVELGFAEPENVLLVGVNLAGAGYDETDGSAALTELLRRTRALPGVRAASVASMVPLGFGGHRFVDARVEGYDAARDENVAVERVGVGSEYFSTMGIPQVSGRAIQESDRADGQPVAVVNQAFVRRFMPGSEQLGRRIDLGRGWISIAGVVQDSKYGDLTETAYPVAYVPVTQWYQPALTVHVRSTSRAILSDLTQLFSTLHPDLAALEPRTLAEHLSASTFVQRIGATMLAAFGILALLLSAVGLYGVLAYLVSLHTREIGIRIALGAPLGIVAGLLVRRAAVLVVVGVMVGIALSVAAGAALRAQLVNVAALDARTYATVMGVFALVALSASLWPAWHALRVDPVRALRSD